MKRFVCLLAIIGIAIVAQFGGCGEDDDNVTGTQLVAGDTTAYEYQEVRGLLYSGMGMERWSLMHLNSPLRAFDSIRDLAGSVVIPRGLKAPQDTLILEYHADSRYWYHYRAYEAAITTYVLTDSIQFLHGDSIVQWPDSALLSAVKIGCHYVDSSAGQWLNVVEHDITLTGYLYAGYPLSLSGQQSLLAESYEYKDVGTGDTCHTRIDFNSTMTELGVTRDGLIDALCPTSGMFASQGTVLRECHFNDSSHTLDGGWTIRTTYADTMMTITFENQTYRWVWESECGGYLGLKSGAILSPFLDPARRSAADGQY